jgi:cell division protein FtsW
MMFMAGMKNRYLFGLGALGVAGFAGLLVIDPNKYWLKRFTSFLDPFESPLDEGYQVVQSLLAMGSGGLFGVGLGQSIQKNLYLPEPQNDFILAIIGEELGFVGLIVLLIVYAALIWRGVHISANAPDQFGLLLAAGITAMLAIQVVLNVAVVTSSMPPTGISLPLVSYGGNALMLFMGAMGILLNISRHTIKLK